MPKIDWNDPEARREYYRNQNRQYRIDAIKNLGGCCVVCGYDDSRALVIDHINGGGEAERGAVNGKKGPSTRKAVIRASKDNTEGLQLLCASHNLIKQFEQNEWRYDA